MCAVMPGQTNPRPAPIPPQPRHTLHTLCLHAMCRPIAHHETAQDRLRLDSTAASPVTDSWLTTQPATLHIPLLVATSTLLSCVVQLSDTLTSPPLQRMAMAYPHTCVHTPQLYNSTLLCCHSLSQISQQQCALPCPARPIPHPRLFPHSRDTRFTHCASMPCAARLPTMR